MRLSKKALKDFCENFIKKPRLSCPENLAKVSKEGRELLYKAELAKLAKTLKGNSRANARRRLRSMFGLRKPRMSISQVMARGFIKALDKQFDLGVDFTRKPFSPSL